MKPFSEPSSKFLFQQMMKSRQELFLLYKDIYSDMAEVRGEKTEDTFVNAGYLRVTGAD